MTRRISICIVVLVFVGAGSPVGSQEVDDTVQARALESFQTLADSGVSTPGELADVWLNALAQEFGAEHPVLLMALNASGVAAFDLGNYAEARRLFARQVELAKKTLGPEHLGTLTAMSWLAGMYNKTGDYSRAFEIEENILSLRRRILGPEHPDTLTALANLAGTLKAQGDFNGARRREEEVLEARRRVLGSEHPDTLTALAKLAGTLKAQGDFDEARKRGEEVFEARRRILGTEHPDTLTALANLATLLKAQGDLDGARKHGEEVLKASRRILGNEHPNTLTALANLATTLFAQGDLDSARKHEEDVLEASRRILGNEHPDTLTALANLTTTLFAQGDLDGARKHEEEILEARQRILGNEHPNTLTALAHLATTLFAQGDLDGARKRYEEVLEASRRILGNEHPNTLTALANLATTLRAQGDLEGARKHGEEVLEARRKILGKEHPDTLKALANLATTLSAQGDLDGARKRYEEVLQARRRILGEEHPDTLVALANLARTLGAQGDLDGARKREEEVLDAHRRILGKEHPSTLTALANLATTLSAQGDLDGARKRYEEVLQARRRILGEEHPDTLGTIHSLAVTLLSSGRVEDAQVLLEEIADTREDADTFFFLGTTYRAVGKLQQASDSFLKGLDALEAQALKVDFSEEIKIRFRTRYSVAYREALALALKQHQLEEAFQILERYRAQSLLMLLRWGQPSTDRELRPEEQHEFLAVAREYDSVIHRLDRLGLKPGLQQHATTLHAEHAQLQRRLEVLRGQRIHANSGENASRQLPLRPDEIRRQLDLGTAMLAYSVGNERVDLFVLSKEAPLESHSLPVSQLELWMQRARFLPLLLPTREATEPNSLEETLEAADPDARVQLGSWLYDKLLAPAGERLASARRLLILPDGPLHYLPFNALVRPTPDDPRGWQYLVEWKPIHVAQSAAVYAELQKRRRAPTPDGELPARTLVALGDPHYPPPRVDQPVGPGDEEKRLDSLPKAVRSAESRGLFELKPLPHTHREVTEIGRLFADAEIPARTYLGAEATEERAKAELSQARYIHLAAHGLADPDIPDNSFIALTIPEGLPEDRDNGILQGWEIMDTLRLDADLVVLSACVTAFGPNRGGEGLMSLSRAFQIAGARTVAASLWPVADDSTAELMIRFYRHLLDGMPKDEALRAAQMELIAAPIEYVNALGETVTGDFRAPYHWAAFQLIGDWQ